MYRLKKKRPNQREVIRLTKWEMMKLLLRVRKVSTIRTLVSKIQQMAREEAWLMPEMLKGLSLDLGFNSLSKTLIKELLVDGSEDSICHLGIIPRLVKRWLIQ